MKRRILCLMASLLLCGAVSAQTHFTAPNAYERSANTPIVAAVTVDNAAPATGAELAVYVGNELRGLATSEEFVDGNYWVQVYYNTGDTETLTFKLWNPAGEGTELDTYTLTYDGLTELTTCEEGYGTPGAPVQLAFTATQTQTTNLAAGWNWFAPTVEISLENLELSLGENGVIIRAQDGKFAMYDEDDEEWSGNLLSLIPGQMYMIQVVSSCSPSLTGRPISNITHTIVLGNNWFGYTNRQTMLVEDAFDDFSPVEGDRIKSADGKFAIYEDDEWSGNLLNLVPGQGYIYVSQDEETKNLIIPAN